MTAASVFTASVNHARYRGQAEGHYESFFVRANHPARPLAFWLRYTLFSPRGKPERALGELWAIFFDGESNRHAVAKQEFRLEDCDFATSAFRVRIGEATLEPNRVRGAAEAKGERLTWNLTFEGDSPPALLLPLKLYRGGFPAAKSLASLPMARFGGALIVNNEAIDVTDWRGSQNHNWGPRHTDLYAWGQVVGFDAHPESFLEIATARLRIGPFWSPPITPVVLRHKGREYCITGLWRAVRAKGGYTGAAFCSKRSSGGWPFRCSCVADDCGPVPRGAAREIVCAAVSLTKITNTTESMVPKIAGIRRDRRPESSKRNHSHDCKR